ncbi:hypothetical protein [Ruminococcus albus]|uniref:ABC-2 family transporter protein n=1 Tax=Ruminococcus albus (strain ATCC 27210 / DSM 20455 / JCM 14654 / NCDO 2250 / 7) TaxID=697329 RepID=E6UC28_RUMA7|nr:hypothetical protein [Ruminococcus albus]ADU22650.1 hypothetical protein Rumal_2164 [Ruminococcus albus 7 = DSM 20455]
MKNLIKAQLYQISRTRVYYLVFITLMMLAVLFGAVEYLNGADNLEEWQKLTASDFATRMEMVVSIAMMGIAFFAAFFCADDFSDKTMNYEMMSGKLRKQTYFSRASITIVFCTIFGLVMVSTSLGVSYMLTGWGDSVPFSAAAVRILLLVFPFFRVSCLFIMIAYFIKRAGFAFLTDYMIFAVSNLIKSADDESGVLTVFSTVGSIMRYKEWHIFGLESPVEMVYTPMPEAGLIIRCILVSLAVGGLYLLLGYNFFHTDDLE